MNIEINAKIWEVKNNEKGLSVRFSEDRKGQDGNWVQTGSGWASIKKDAIAVIQGLPQPQGNAPYGLVKMKGIMTDYNQKQNDGSYSRGYITIFEASVINSQNQNQTAATTQQAAPVQTQTQAPVQQTPVQQAPAQQQVATQEIDELPFS